MMQTDFNRHNFPEMVSVPHHALTWVIRAVLVLIGTVLVICLYGLPVAIAYDPYYGKLPQTKPIVFLIVYPILIVLTWLLAGYIWSVRPKAVVAIKVDAVGIHYRHKDSSSSSIRYKDLQRNDNRFLGDVYSVTPYRVPIMQKGPPVLKVVKDGKHIIVNVQTDAGYSYFSGNHRELRAYFIRGIKTFRPDLRINDTVFVNFYINRKTLMFDGKSYITTVAGGIVISILIIVCVLWYTGAISF